MNKNNKNNIKVINFADTKNSFAIYSNLELLRSYLLFLSMKYSIIVTIGSIILRFLLKIKAPIKELIKITLYKQFCGGENLSECAHTIKYLKTFSVNSILDFAAEGANSNAASEYLFTNILQTITFAKATPGIPFAVFKPSALIPHALLEAANMPSPISKNDTHLMQECSARIEELCKQAVACKIPIVMDAEESWIQNYPDKLIETLMEKYNTENIPYVYTTLQMYRNDRLQYLEYLIEKSKSNGFKLGIKLVRGAYLEKEILHAKTKKEPIKVFTSKTDTDVAFDKAVDLIVSHRKNICLILGTHNKNSVNYLVELMQHNNIPSNNANFWFSQLLGMSNNITFLLAKNGYNVAKYVPWGKVEHAIPYLLRRAQENTSVKGQTPRELSLISQEILRRKKIRNVKK